MKPQHPFSQRYPRDKTAVRQLEESMRRMGFDPSEPIVLFEGKVIDGRHREEAAERLGIKPVYVDFEGSEEQALEYVFVKNVQRRHLTKGALALAYIDHNLHGAKRTDAEIAAILGVGQTTVSKARQIHTALADKPGDVQQVIAGKKSLAEASPKPRRTMKVTLKQANAIEGLATKRKTTFHKQYHECLSKGIGLYEAERQLEEAQKIT